ncbi:MAG: hypothetical protein PHE67_05710 [Campylobacterales bacterium]|nr:hypothetical protein [Campylobacterales bacterium]
MKITIDNIEHDIKDGETLDVSGFEFVGNGFDKSKADKLGVGTWNEKNIKNFVLLYTLIKSMYSKADIDALFESLYTKNEVDVAIDDRINFLIGSAPQNLDTLYEISQRLGEDDTKIAQILDLIAQKANKSDLLSLSIVNPCVFAYLPVNQSVPKSSTVKALLSAVDISYNNIGYDSANSRFKPTSAGVYFFSFHCLGYGVAFPYKNGSLCRSMIFPSSSSNVSYFTGTVYLNGTTDFFEIFINNPSTYVAVDITSGSSNTYLEMFKVS